MLRALLRFALLACVLGTAGAQLPPADAQAIRGVVSDQLEAFGRDDAERAFSLATDAIRARFGSAAEFIHMVRTAYPAVYRPRTARFEAPFESDGDVIQPVRLTDAEGRAWLALYPMRRQPGGAWRIDGCVLRRLAAQET